MEYMYKLKVTTSRLLVYSTAIRLIKKPLQDIEELIG